MLDIFNTKKLEAAKAQLANSQAQIKAQEKKTRTAIIAGSSTTGVAVAAIATHFLFGNGKKINRNKLKNYDNVLEERNKAIDEVADLTAKYQHATNMAIAADGCCCRLSAAIDSKDPAEIYAAKQGHKQIHASIFGDVSQESVNAAVKAYEDFIKSLNDQNAQNDQIPQNNQIPQNAQNDQNAQNNQNNQNDQAQNDQKIADAQNRYNDACAKAGTAKTAFENAEKKLADAKTTDPNGDHKDLEAAVNAAKAAFDAADKELVDAKNTLDALQANQQK